jgi:hypothetical protein
MTTVINLNILNFLKLKHDEHTVNDYRLNSEFPESNKEHATDRERTIDITPQNRILKNKEVDLLPAVSRFRQARLPVPQIMEHKTYDRKGNSVQYIHEKGINIDSYV